MDNVVGGFGGGWRVTAHGYEPQDAGNSGRAVSAVRSPSQRSDRSNGMSDRSAIVAIVNAYPAYHPADTFTTINTTGAV